VLATAKPVVLTNHYRRADEEFALFFVVVVFVSLDLNYPMALVVHLYCKRSNKKLHHVAVKMVDQVANNDTCCMKNNSQ
jgi:hypothetical protein